MKFEEKYSLKDEAGKIKISPDFSALCDVLQSINNKLEQLRRQL